MSINTIKISVVTVCYNAEKEIERTILSVIGQTYPSIQYIIVDGNSTDKTMEIVRKYKKYIDVIISEQDKGIFDAMNKSLQYVQGDFLNFMNAGDRFYSNNTITEIFDGFIDKIKIGFIYGKAADSNGYVASLKPFMFSKGLRNMGICHQAIFVRKSLALKYKFDLVYKVSADYAMMYNIIESGFIAKEVDVVVCYYEGGGFSNQRPWLMLHDEARITNSTNKFEYKHRMLIFRIKYWVQKIAMLFHIRLFKINYQI